MYCRTVGAILISALPLLSGCELLRPITPGVCPDVVSRAIEVEVRDAQSGQPAAHGALGIAREGSFVDTLQIVGWETIPSPESAYMFGGLYERPGVYVVRVEKDGYQPWERSGVRAERGVCGVITVRLHARLERTDS